MKFARPLFEGVLIRRYKRFLADVRLPCGDEVTVHVPNSGTMKTCSDPGSRVWISEATNPKRKLAWTLEIIEVGDGALALVNTFHPNRIVREAIEAGVVPALRGYDSVRAEVKYGEHSRVDLLLESGDRPRCWVEVKNVTLLERPGLASFPDAVTTRGTKHLRELMNVVAQGERGVLFFHVPRGDAGKVRPADAIDPVYGQTLREAAAAGVEIMAWLCSVSTGEVVLQRPIEVILDP